MALILWVPALSVGVKEMDDQHKKIFEIINKINDALTLSEDEKFLPDIFQDLVDYANVHLDREEFYFAKFDYPEKEGHILAHQAYKDKIEEFRIRWQGGEPGIASEIISFLENWWQNHIYKMDKRYSKFFQEHGLK